MKEFVEKLICGLEEQAEEHRKYWKEFGDEDSFGGLNAIMKAISIVNQLAEEYKDKVIIDGQYCWQTCGANEHCKECNRLSNGSIDYYENYDCLAEEYNNGWIPCSERLPNKEKYLKDGGRFIATDGNRVYQSLFDIYSGIFVKDYFGSAPIEDNCVIAWQPLPAPFKKGE